MKKIALLAAMLLMMGLLAGCSLGECDACGETGILEEVEIMGMTSELCGDCRDELDAAMDEAKDALSELANGMEGLADEF